MAELLVGTPAIELLLLRGTARMEELWTATGVPSAGPTQGHHNLDTL